MTEFMELAKTYLDSQSFENFWEEVWIGRIKEEVDKLDGCNLTDAERRNAKNIGVRWCEPPSVNKTKDKNPYARRPMEWYFFELDLICPNYREPSPEGLRQIR